MTSDLRHALFALRRAPGLVVAATVVLALGIGANAAVFSLAGEILLRPLPGVARPAGLVNVHATAPGGERHGSFSYLDYRDYRDRGRALAGLGRSTAGWWASAPAARAASPWRSSSPGTTSSCGAWAPTPAG
jgi:hypothetical protein